MANETIDLEAIANEVIEQGASLTDDQRVEMIQDTDWCAEGEYRVSELEGMSDVELCEAYLSAMWDWVRCNT